MSSMYKIDRTDTKAIQINSEAEMAKVAAVATAAAHDEQQITELVEDSFHCRPWDVAVAFTRAAQELLGETPKGLPSESMFGSTPAGMHNFPIQELVYQFGGDRISRWSMQAEHTRTIIDMAAMRGLPVPSPWSEEDREEVLEALLSDLEVVGVSNREVRVPFGEVELNKEGKKLGEATIGGKMDPELGALGVLKVRIQNKNLGLAEELFRRTKEILKTDSIYRGRAIDSSEDRPSFWDPFTVNPNTVVLSEENITAIQNNIMFPIKWRERALARDPRLLKRTFIWSGEYGTGKSMTMILMAQWAVKHGWTVIRHKAGSDDLSKTMQLARLMEPCLVLVEDAEVFANSSDKETVSKLLDDFDGMLSKSGQVITILTTNHEHEITKGMTRPGRIDGLMRFATLDRPGVQQLFISMLGVHTVEAPIPSRLFQIVELGQEVAEDLDVAPGKLCAKCLLPLRLDVSIVEVPGTRLLAHTGCLAELDAEVIDWDAVYDSVSMYTGAFMAEVVKRVNLQLLNREIPVAGTQDLLRAADSLRTQYEVYVRAGEPEHRNALDEALTSIMAEAVSSLDLTLETGLKGSFTTK